ncbi:DNA polymerase III subunit delta' [Granulicoccus phenolivorans]|uniref:DNA polymerase III subunit delta' n=1 Tax=Granulicoccus phenolivorans TaxID=266854 RepID=UPI0004125377|nr:DNA polymerase III subunit delta' [Granulicoccus phenolivorans]
MTTETAAPGVWADLVGQPRAVATLQRAVIEGRHAMSHAWLITGPPGSGRSNAARAFAAALQCPNHGDGTCQHCRSTLSGAHPDVTLLQTERLSIGVDEVRELIQTASLRPGVGRYQIIVIEDADRLTDPAADALLKAIEEPPARTVWLLCAPTPDDVLVTIRSRCRKLSLRTPPDAAVAELLIRRDGIDPSTAAFAARAAQGHIGRARALARNEAARNRRHAVLQIPGRLRDIGSCLNAAEHLVESGKEEAARQTAELDARERAALETALGVGTTGVKPKQLAAAQKALKELEEEQKKRATRMVRDQLDFALTELTGFYRDVLSAQIAAEVPLINAEAAETITALARRTTPEKTLACIDAILQCRTDIEGAVNPLLAMEALMLTLGGPFRGR